MPPRLAEETALLYQALGSALGLVVQVEDFDLARSRLYKARQEAGDPDLDVIQLRRSPFTENEIWIVRSAPIPSKTSEATLTTG